MKVFQINVIAVLCVLSMLLSSGQSDSVKRFYHGRLKRVANKTLVCYLRAHYIYSIHRGGPLWNDIRKVLIQTNPSSAKTGSLRNQVCLTGLSSLTNALQEIIKTDTTVALCSDGKAVKNHFVRLRGHLKDIINYYTSALNVTKSSVSLQLDMKALTKLATRDANNLLLKNGKRGVVPEVLRNLEIFDLIYAMSRKLWQQCI